MDSDIAKSVLWLALAFLCLAAGGGLAYALWRVGRLLRRLDRSVHDVTDEVVPIIGKAGVSLDTVNVQLQKVDVMMDSAVDMTEAVDTTVRAVSMAVTEPVKKVSGVVTGVTEGLASFRERVADDDGFGVDRPVDPATEAT